MGPPWPGEAEWVGGGREGPGAKRCSGWRGWRAGLSRKSGYSRPCRWPCSPPAEVEAGGMGERRAGAGWAGGCVRPIRTRLRPAPLLPL